MTQSCIIQSILKDSNYHLALFAADEITALQEKVLAKSARGKEMPFVKCIVRDKDIQLKPEEIVRQLYAAMLINQYGYPKTQIKFEHSVTFGKEKKSADIVIFDKDRTDTAYIIVELKKPKLKDGKDQLRSYCNATGAPIGVWTNGEQISHYHRKDPNYFLEKMRAVKNENKQFNFDILMANPPFAGDIKESRILHQYELGFKAGRKNAQNKVGRDILFVERNLDFLKPGGRMAIVLPQGRFNNTMDKHIREFIAQHARILAVVGLHGNTFKPHTGTKTSVLFVQKWDDQLCPKVDDYPIFFAVSEKGGKDNSGDYVYLKSENRQEKLDKNGHLIVNHDLHNHDGELPDGIAEAFIEWAKSERLNFWN
ncbi:type I restriction enzyme HsdR N-terminal domain-containing protein [Candidatus Spongiihabitans sp.]|uniref:type I restriction enzyme HsdR N-terminal domain-containing protein n=1 Tax=Candidatus Spongiihabitans sp. TaxID=3101308 RepID=UPI003C6FAA28